jgi:hypothetical protein
VTFLSGETGPTSPATIDPAAFAIQGFKAGQPTDIKIAGTAAQFIDLEPAGAQTASAVRIENQTIRIEPDRRYRFTVAKIPMMEEAATFIVVTEAPLDRFDAFLTTADQLLGTLGFFRSPRGTTVGRRIRRGAGDADGSAGRIDGRTAVQDEAGGMFWFSRNRLSGSYSALMRASRSQVAPG